MAKQTIRVVIERKKWGYFHIYEQVPDAYQGRGFYTEFCEADFISKFPAFASLPADHSVEADITITPVGKSLPWNEWTWNQ